MKKRGFTKIEYFGPENKKIISNILNEIIRQIELKSDDNFVYILTGDSEEKSKLFDVIEYLVRILVMSSIKTIKNEEGMPVQIIGEVNRLLVYDTVTRINQSRIEAYKKTNSFLNNSKTDESKNTWAIALEKKGKNINIVKNDELVLSSIAGSAPADLLKILFDHRNSGFLSTDYIIKNTQFSDKRHVWDTIKEFRKRIIGGTIESGERKQGYMLILHP